MGFKYRYVSRRAWMDKKKPISSEVINGSLIAAAYWAFEPNTIRQIIQLSFVSISTGI